MFLSDFIYPLFWDGALYEFLMMVNHAYLTDFVETCIAFRSAFTVANVFFQEAKWLNGHWQTLPKSSQSNLPVWSFLL